MLDDPRHSRQLSGVESVQQAVGRCVVPRIEAMAVWPTILLRQRASSILFSFRVAVADNVDGWMLGINPDDRRISAVGRGCMQALNPFHCPMRATSQQRVDHDFGRLSGGQCVRDDAEDLISQWRAEEEGVRWHHRHRGASSVCC
jgi:hypothetical protein